MIQNLANGEPPYTAQQEAEDNIAVNVSDLQHTRLMHDGRSQFNNGFMKSGNKFTCRTDCKPVHKREKYSSIVTAEWNRPVKRSIAYFERQRAKFGMLVLHGISPGAWEREDDWCARPVGIEDVLVPSRTLLGFENLPFFFMRRSFTGPELQRLTRKEKRDPGWNMDLVNAMLRWIDDQMVQLRSRNWPEVWAPEKAEERMKEEAGYYLGDEAPKVDAFDCYFYVGEGDHTGWVRRIILDSWNCPEGANGTYSMSRKNRSGLDDSSDFIFSSGDTPIYDSWQNVIAFQYADLSATFPARYHSVRSLGWLTYAACHLGMRMRCKFYEAVLEALMQLFKVKSADDVQRALKLDLINRGVVDDTMMPVPASERWQVNADLVELGLQDNQRVISENAASWVQNKDYSRDNTEKTRFQVMAELNAVTSLVGAALNQAYQYEVFEDREMIRRFCRVNSTNADVRSARERILRQGVPEKLLVPEAWEVEHERTMGGGSKQMEMTIANWLIENMNRFDPDPQRKILRSAVLAFTDDAARAEDLVPETPTISDSIHDTELAYGTLMAGGMVTPKLGGLNPLEVAGTMIREMNNKVSALMQMGGMASPAEIQGLNACAQYAAAFIQMLAKDENQKANVKALGDQLGKVMNQVKAFQQRLQQAMKAQAQGNGNGDGTAQKEALKVQSAQAMAQIKQDNTRQSHAQRTAQRSLQFEEQMRQRREEHRQKMREAQDQHRMDLSKQMQQSQLDIAKADMETAAGIQRNRLSSLSDQGSDKE